MSKKRNGKINTCAIDGTVKSKEKTKKNRRGLTDKEIDERIRSLVEVILREYNYKKCLVIVGDPDDIPESTNDLLEGKGVYGLNCKSLGEKYNNYQKGKYDAYKFMCAVEKLFDRLVVEFDRLEDFLVNGFLNNTKEDNDYERS